MLRMSKLMNKPVLIIISVIISTITYSLVLWTIDTLSQYVGMQSLFGRILEASLFWLSHFGFGLVLFPALIIMVFYLLNRNLKKQTEPS